MRSKSLRALAPSRSAFCLTSGHGNASVGHLEGQQDAIEPRRTSHQLMISLSDNHSCDCTVRDFPDCESLHASVANLPPTRAATNSDRLLRSPGRQTSLIRDKSQADSAEPSPA